MIPTIDTIIAGLLDGTYTAEQAKAWMEEHVTSAIERLASAEQREHVAAMAMQGLLACDLITSADPKRIAESAVEYADALLAELAK